MGVALTLKATGRSAQVIRDLWQRVGPFETAPSMAALGYAPHISFLVCDQADPDELAQIALPILREMPRLTVTFSRLEWFLAPRRVLWAAPDEHSVASLLTAHEALHAALPRVRCQPHYALRNWTPHCTLGLAFPDDQFQAAERFAKQALAPTDVVFDTADVITFSPIKVFEEAPLRP
jgi:hypothetical protein